MTPWVFLRYLLLPAAVVTGSLLGEGWNFIVPVICFVIHPLLSLLTGAGQPSHRDEHAEYSSTVYRVVALLFVPILLATTVWAVYRVSHDALSAISITGLLLSTGIMNGIIGFTLAHEFIHRQNKVDKIAGHLLLLQNNYLHYSIEHIGGHHLYACTSKDPHTARINESFYLFLPRAIASTFTNAWEIECRRLIKKQYSIIGLHNRMLVFLFLHCITAIMIVLVAGWVAFAFLVLQSLVAIGLLHITNYLQHYGLLRKEVSPGRTEKISTHHAWNSRKGKDGLNLFQLEKHADHHLHPNRSYEQLLQHDNSPEMPTGYSGMIMLALMPPLWFRIMNRRIDLFITQNSKT
jgi:alkane 1-monooxygenase